MTRSLAREPSTIRAAFDLAVLLVLGFLCVIGFLWDVVLFRVMVSLNMNDFGKFYYSARSFLDGHDMYAPSPATQLGAGQLPDAQQLLNLNPPHFHLILLPLARLSPHVAVAFWMGASLFALFVSLLVVCHELRFVATLRRVLLLVLFVLVFSGSQAVFITGQLAFLLLLPVTLCWRAARDDRWATAGGWLGICTSIKPFFLIFVPYLVVKRRWRALATMAAATGLCFAIGLIVFGAANYRSWVGALAQSNEWAWLGMNASVLGAFQRAFSHTMSFQPVAVSQLLMRGWFVAAALIGFTTLFVVFSDRSAHAVDRAFALLLIAAQLLSPVGWVYYLWLAASPLAALGSSSDRKEWIPRSAVGLFATIALAGFFTPIIAPYYFQPHALATITLGSVYFWATLALWALTCRYVAAGATSP